MFAHENLAVISVDTFEDAGDRMSMTVSGKQLAWFEEQLERYEDKNFIIVQGHVPVVGPVASKNSAQTCWRGGRQRVLESDGRALTEQHPHRGNGGPWSEAEPVTAGGQSKEQ